MSFQTRKTFNHFLNSNEDIFMKWYSCEHAWKTDTEEKILLNKVIIVVFFVHKMYSHSFIKLRLNWCHIDYFNDVLTTFLGLKRVSCVAVYAGSEKLSNFIKNILICLPKMKVLRERHEGE